jgi:hypothetical protein
MDIDIEIKHKLMVMFPNLQIEPEWPVARNSRDALNNINFYCPRIDFALGPFNIESNLIEEKKKEIDAVYRRYVTCFNNLKSFDNNYINSDSNKNPRCFLTIEVENQNSKKHMMGSIINASAIGKVGIILAKNETALRSLKRIRKYLYFIYENGKFGSVPENIIIITRNQFLET